MTVNERSPRCTCGCAAEVHTHVRPGDDCGRCGRIRCPHYVPMSERDSRYLTWPQRHALAESDTHFYRNLAALGPFARSGERIAATRIPTQRRVVVTTGQRRVLDTRRGHIRRTAP